MKYDRNKLFCFSPPIMIITFVIEMVLVVYTLWRYKLSPLTRLVALLFFFLAMFQLAEFMVCKGSGGMALTWSRIGYVAIAMMPPIGLHITYQLVGATKRPLLIPAYIGAAAFMAFFGLVGHAINGHQCLGNYVIFQVAPGSGGIYGLYYYSLLIATLVLCWRYMKKAKPRTRQALQGLALGYTVFIIPATTVSLLNPEAVVAMPSIMCGFAVFLALAVAWKVLPAADKKS